MKFFKVLNIILIISLGANLWFIRNWYNQNQSSTDPSNNSSKNNNVSAQDFWSTANTEDELTIGPSDNPQENNSQLNTIDKTLLNQESHFRYLASLAKQQEFEMLEFEVRAYLRLYPQDIEAMLLEAQSYYHNKPLNIALVHYHQLLSQPLSPLQQKEIEKLIAVNTTRVIQQFSGDGAWDLLAEFLEPLIQISPLNRQYLMALAHAYGMQSQFSLMEAVLANFPSDDLRASRLRETINARLNTSSQEEPLIDIPEELTETLASDRRADVLLKQDRGHFVTQVRVHNTSVNFLIDTGASTTAISDAKFDSIESDQTEFIGLFNVNTAGGSIEAPIYRINRITIGQRTLVNTSVMILPSENLGRYDGLLGMNVLSQFDLIYDAASQTMRMYKKG